jgi:hypothetical protein
MVAPSSTIDISIPDIVSWSRRVNQDGQSVHADGRRLFGGSADEASQKDLREVLAELTFTDFELRIG